MGQQILYCQIQISGSGEVHALICLLSSEQEEIERNDSPQRPSDLENHVIDLENRFVAFKNQVNQRLDRMEEKTDKFGFMPCFFPNGEIKSVADWRDVADEG